MAEEKEAKATKPKPPRTAEERRYASAKARGEKALRKGKERSK